MRRNIMKVSLDPKSLTILDGAKIESWKYMSIIVKVDGKEIDISDLFKFNELTVDIET